MSQVWITGEKGFHAIEKVTGWCESKDYLGNLVSYLLACISFLKSWSNPFTVRATIPNEFFRDRVKATSGEASGSRSGQQCRLR
jgi:hypothetical protein